MLRQGEKLSCFYYMYPPFQIELGFGANFL